MTKERDPLGKRALFSNGGAGSAQPQESPPARPPVKRRSGPLDVTVTCSACNVASTLSVPEIALRHLPVVAWLPWRKQSLFMRCPACAKLAWHAVSRP